MELMKKQNRVPPLPLYVLDQCMDQLQLRGLSQKRGILSGFHQVTLWLGLNGLRLQGLKEYSDDYLALDNLGPIMGSKCLVMQTTGNYLGLGLRRKPRRGCFRLPPGLSIFYIISVTTSNNVSELSLYSRSVLSKVLLLTVVV
jgi:hypothetical protein